MFNWQANGVALMVAPVQVGEPLAQRYARVDVSVVEQVTPSYALAFSVILLDDTTRQRVELRVTKEMMAKIFEKIFMCTDKELATIRTRQLERGKTGVAFDEAVDTVVLAWIKGSTGARSPTREQLSRWLFSRLVVSRTSAGQCALSLYGVKMDREVPVVPTEKLASPMEDEDELRLSSPPPPPYTPTGSRSDRCVAQVSDSMDFDDEIGDEGAAIDEEDRTILASHRAALDDSRAETKVLTSSRKHSKSENVSTKHLTSVSHSSSARDLAPPSVSDLSISGIAEPRPSRYKFEPAAERHHSFSSMPPPPNAWTEERQHFQLELTMSKRDIELMQGRRRKAEAIASLRRQQIIQQSQKKLLAHEQRLRDSRFVKQSIADTLEYHGIAHRLESQVKQTNIAATREQERLVQTMRIALGRSSDKCAKGPVLGPGPLSQIEIDTLTQDSSRRHSKSMWVYDLHGRRHSESELGSMVADSVFDTAMTKIQRLLDRKASDSIDLFKQYDRNKNGTLDRSEFERLLEENGVHLSTDQRVALFSHFDPNRSGAIDYGELLWGFFNRRAFMKRWKQRKMKLSAREIKLMFFKYDRIGRGALALQDFQSALDDIGFRVSESEAKLLCVRFDTDKDGFIDYNEFHAFMNDDETKDSAQTRVEAGGRKKMTRSTTQLNIGSATGDSDMDRILAELRALNETQQAISRAVLRT